jgi:hypothetical protein
MNYYNFKPPATIEEAGNSVSKGQSSREAKGYA